jgi:hypothetical protein
VKQSLKVKSPEGLTRSFNSYNLRRIYGPPPEPEAALSGGRAGPAIQPESAAPESKPPAAAPRREVIEEPDFTQPIVPIRELSARPDFPKTAFGKHVDIGGYTGVVVEIVNQSLKVRSRQGTSRSYNALRLQAIYGGSR